MVYYARWAVMLVVAVCLLGVALAAPNLFARVDVESLPGWVPNQQINLGLDLQGGSHLLLEVDVAAVLREQLETVVDTVRINLRRARIGYRGLGIDNDHVRFSLRQPGDADKARKALAEIGEEIELDIGDGGGVTLGLTEESVTARRSAAVEQSIEIIRRRIDETGTREPSIQRQGVDRILVQLPGVEDPDRIKRLLGRTAKMNFRLVDETTAPVDARRGRLPPGSQILPTDEIDSAGNPEELVVRKRVIVSGERLIDAQPTFQDAQPVVSFRFDTVGGKRFGDATTKGVGKRLAIVLDGRVISAPVIREPILGGNGIISGSFTVPEANDLALLLRAGALPAPLTILEERTVGPSMGADSIRAGKIASVLGLILVVVFMGLVYGLFGLMANVALVFNLFLIAGVLSLLQATLTLPGIAGIVLTIGMAVDANVLIFERIREEVRAGRTPISAIDAGYRRALSTIVDANITTLIAAILLFQFGSGPIKGFAVTLAIGIMTSMFTAIMVTRLLVVWWLRQRRPQVLPI